MDFSCSSVKPTIQLGVFCNSGGLFSLALSCSLKDLNLLQENILLVGRYFVDWKCVSLPLDENINAQALQHEASMWGVYSKMKPDSFRSQFQAVLTTYYEDIKEVQGAICCTKAKCVKRRFQDVNEAGDDAAAAAAPAADASAASAPAAEAAAEAAEAAATPDADPALTQEEAPPAAPARSPAGKPAGKGRSRAPKG